MAGAAAPWAEQAVADGPGMTAARQRTYGALVAAVGAADDTQVVTADADEATNAFVSWYGTRVAEAQRTIDNLLDALEAAPPSGSFAAMSRTDRLAYLANMSGDVRSSVATLSAAETRRRALAGEVISLANYAFYPAPDDSHAPTPTRLVA
jgi:hypothetical protein